MENNENRDEILLETISPSETETGADAVDEAPEAGASDQSDENARDEALPEAPEKSDAESRDDALFENLSQSKKKKKKRRIRTIIIVLAVVAIALTAGVLALRRRVATQFASRNTEVTSAEVTRGSISTQVSGSGTLMNVDEESITVPAGVTVEEVLVSAQDNVAEGQEIARVNKASVRTAMDSVQDEISSLDKDITSAASDKVDKTIKAGISGRVKRIYVEADEDIASCMVENGALALLSLDGYMSVEIQSDTLSAGQTVNVVRSDGKVLSGTVDTVTDGTASILVTDNGPEPDEAVTVQDENSNELGSGTLSVHSPLRVSGITGTVARVNVKENQSVSESTTLFTLTETSYTARYETLLQERKEQEDLLLELLSLYQTGYVTAPYSGMISSVDYGSDDDDESMGDEEETALVTLTPADKMQVTVNVDESNIHSLEVGQTATVTISSVGDDPFDGVVTEINKNASSASGVTSYTAVITLEKAEGMLQGMSAKAVIRIQGVDDALMIPVDALHQTSSQSYVYTTYDEETKEFGGLVQVTAGITNSNYVEITSGLNEGDTVWYTPQSKTSFGNFPGGGSFPGGGDFSGGGFPGGGDFGGGGFPGGGDFGGSRPDSSKRPGSGTGGRP